jgi:protein gp37
MSKTSIEWTDHSINPIRARNLAGAVGHYCEKISSGCARCYASNFQKRFHMPDFGKVKTQLPDGIEVYLDESTLRRLMRRKKPTKFFWCDMTDIFGWWVKDEWIDYCFAVMAATPWHTHQVLTKRPERAREYFENHNPHLAMTKLFNNFRNYTAPVGPWPLENVWLGVSVENQEQADARIPELLKIPAAVRFLSCEPLLGPVELTRLFSHCPVHDFASGMCVGPCPHRHDLHWVIGGGESGHDARPMHPDWVREICAQCMDAQVPFFFKQWGAWSPSPSDSGGRMHRIEDVHVFRCDGDPCFGEDCSRCQVLWRVGKKAAGRLLDGREWSEFPAQPIPF